jgi:phosphopantothenoylcysteine decarboxylase/phosphopantothenate--cysteine ligase
MLACGYNGQGRLPDPETIFAEINQHINKTTELKGETILVTAGGTVEPIDNVRFITNISSGKMGIALADACARKGAKVILLKSKNSVVPRQPMQIHEFTTATELEVLLNKKIKKCTHCFHAAAVSDFSVEFKAGKRSSRKQLNLILTPRKKLYLNLKQINPQLKLFLFKAEYRKPIDLLIKKAQSLIKNNNIDGVIINDIGQPDRGFNVDTNEVTIVLGQQATYNVPLALKSVIAEKIVEICLTK